MKKFTSLVAVLLGFVLTAEANPITRAEARLVADEFVGISDTASDEVPIAPYYVFSRGAGKGYVIVSGDDSTAPVLGYTDEGDFVWDQLPEALQDMLDSWAGKIQQVQAVPKRNQVKRSVGDRLLAARRGVEAFKEKWEDVPYLCQTHWNQGSPYNNLCPVNPTTGARAVTGCVATAAAQIIYYFHKDNPDSLVYDTPTYTMDWGSDYGNYPVTESLPKGTPVEYDQMRLSGSGTARQNNAVATLMFAIGASSRLNYGPSTAGQPDEAGKAMKNQFMLDNTYAGKWNYSQQGWETMIYRSLKNGSPMLYGGTHPTNGGHAVVLDGYQAKTGLYHFNFGWGGSGDGYYTVDDETGMNGFKADQRGCLNFKPRKPNLKATMQKNDLYHRSTSTLAVHISNDGTLNYSGFYLYISTNGKLPANPTKKDDETVIRAGEEGDVTFTYQPTTSPSRNPEVYLFVTDANKNILDSCHVKVYESVADLELQEIGVDAGQTTREVDGMTFATVNNTTATVSALLTNGPAGTHCQPQLNCLLYSYDTETKTWNDVTHVYAINDVFEPAETHAVSFAFRSLTEGYLYKATLEGRARASEYSDLRYATADTVVYFTVRKPDFQMTVDGRTATASGNWNAGLFQNAGVDASVLSFDMTGVKELDATPATDNPNAVFYTSYPVAGASNVICDDVCERLVVHAGQEFAPAKAFTATDATLVLDDCKTAAWNDVLVPFAVEIPYGMQVKRITAVSSSAVSSENVRNLPSAEAVIYLSAHDGLNALHGKQVAIPVDTVLKLADENVTAATVYSPVATRSMLFGFKSNIPYYLPTTATAAAPFTPVVTKYSSGGVRAIAIADVYYPELAEAVNEATQLLEQNPAMAGSSAQATFAQAIQKAEDMFTYASASAMSEIRQETADLKEAMDAFLAAVATGIETPAVSVEPADGPVEYYSISGVRLQQPERGMVIVKRGNSVKKVMVK